MPQNNASCFIKASHTPATPASIRDLDVVQVLIEMGPEFNFPVGLRVDVYLEQAARKE
jgi:hypothetical protein